VSCPAPETLTALVALELAAAVERDVRAHVGVCVSCERTIRRLDPTWIFVGMPRMTLTDDAWDEVMSAVRDEVRTRPQRSPAARWIESLFMTRLVPAAAAAALGGLLLFALPGAPPDRAAPSPVAVLVDRADDRGGAPAGFEIRLDNPRAEVSHALLAGADDAAPVQLTMVIDESLEDLF